MKMINNKKFTMIELLVVSAVIATIISMVVSSIKSSQEMAKQATCMSNIGQIRIVTELYRKNNSKLPYSEIWLTDFSFAQDYLSENGLDIFTCPGSDDEDLTEYGQLTNKTSYYYIPNASQLMANIADGSQYGIDMFQLAAMADMQDGIIYDKSADHHNGKRNAAYLFKHEDTTAEYAGQIRILDNTDNFLAMDSTGIIDLPPAETLGTLNINPSNSDDNLFTLTNLDGTTIEIRDGIENGTCGLAKSITIKVKSTGRTITINDEEMTLRTNTTYTFSVDMDNDDFFGYMLTNEADNDGNANGQWWIDIIQGVGEIGISSNR
jgi:type II secretory pathway pseudopilin PulG